VRRIPVVILLSVTALLTPGLLLSQTRGKPSKPTSASPPAIARGGPLTLPEIIECLNTITFGPSYCEKSVRTRGVNFRAEPVSVLDILKEFGATQATLDAIPRAPKPPNLKYSGPLTIRCEPADCLVIINDKLYGSTKEGQTIVPNLPLGRAVVQIFKQGYQSQTQELDLPENKPSELNLQLKALDNVNLLMVKESLLDTIRAMGGIEGISSLGEVEGEGTMDWVDKDNQPQHWPVTFTKRSGKDLTLIFKTRDGQCSASISGSNRKQECKGKLKNSAEGISDQAATLFLSYQVQSVLNDLLTHISGLSFAEGGKRLESSDSIDSYVLTLGEDKLPLTLQYTRANKPEAAVVVKYSDYKQAGKGRYPGQMQIGSTDGTGGFTFRFTTIRSR
jgi:hypothetical protein